MAVYWRERGGTPQGIPVKLAPIAVTPGMRLWLRLDEELAAGTDESGFYRPEALELVFGWYETAILQWFRSVYGAWLPRSAALLRARTLMRYLSAGRAEARAEAFDHDDD